MKIIWSVRAQANLHNIVEYISRDDPVAAQRLVDGLVDSMMAILAEHPKAGRAGRVENTREWVAHKHYIVVYRIKRETLVVAAVVQSDAASPITSSAH